MALFPYLLVVRINNRLTVLFNGLGKDFFIENIDELSVRRLFHTLNASLLFKFRWLTLRLMYIFVLLQFRL